MRNFSPLDRLICGADRTIKTLAGAADGGSGSPADNIDESELSASERRHAAGLMRVNHTGEVCAQALYLGQSWAARSERTASFLSRAAAEEGDHLAWCALRLDELDARPSVLNPAWFAASSAIGCIAAFAGDRVSLGFVEETERQVVQ